MVGDERVRHCDSCQLNVYNFSEMTRREVESLVLKTEGRLCGRMYRRADGTILTRDCPVGLRAVRLKVAKFAGAVFATLLSICSITFSQTRKQSQAKPNYTIEVVSKELTNGATLKGILTDEQGAVIALGQVTLQSSALSEKMTCFTNENGEFSFEQLPRGTYSLTVWAVHFTQLTLADVEVKSNEAYEVHVSLKTNETLEMMGLVAGTELLKTPTIEMIKELPIKRPHE
jgi:hypothetical protein